MNVHQLSGAALSLTSKIASQGLTLELAHFSGILSHDGSGR
jgi:hypothetical protein